MGRAQEVGPAIIWAVREQEQQKPDETFPIPDEIRAKVTERIWKRLGGRDRLRKRACLSWEGATAGRGQIPVVNAPTGDGRRTTRSVARLLYEDVLGQIPEDHALVSTCEGVRCVNPHHLEPSRARRRPERADTEEAISAALAKRGSRCVEWIGSHAGDYPLAWVRDEQGVIRKRSARIMILDRAGIPDDQRRRLPSCGKPGCVQVNHLVV
jgi:hypothetical protein